MNLLKQIPGFSGSRYNKNSQDFEITFQFYTYIDKNNNIFKSVIYF